MSRKRFYAIAGGVVVFILLGCIGSIWILEVPFYLAFGWIWHIARVVPNLSINPGGIGLIVLCIAAASWLGHNLATWLWTGLGRDGAWRGGWTMLGMLSILLMFAAGVAATGVVHQTGWLMNGPQRLVKSTSRIAYQVKCASNMRQIGMAISMYANVHGQRPSSLQELLHIMAVEDTGTEVLTCPATEAIKAPGPTSREWIAQVADRPDDHLSYIFVPGGVRIAPGDGLVILYEPLSNHDQDGINVLYEDGHTEFLPSKLALDAMNRIEVAATTRPAITPPSPVPR